MLLLLMYVLSCLAIILSIVLDMKERLDMGRQLERVYLSMDWFLGMGITWAYFMWDGKIPAVSERSIIFVEWRKKG